MLPNIPIREERKDFMTDQGRLARACRLLVEMELFDRMHGRFRQDAMLDTGAAFGVFPFSLWNSHNLSWTPLGSQMLTLQGHPDPDALKWLGISCELGAAQIALIDETNRPSRPLRIVGKFVRSPLPARFEKYVILGYQFLMDNSLTLTVEPASRASIGNIANVVGFLTVP